MLDEPRDVEAGALKDLLTCRRLRPSVTADIPAIAHTAIAPDRRLTIGGLVLLSQ